MDDGPYLKKEEKIDTKFYKNAFITFKKIFINKKILPRFEPTKVWTTAHETIAKFTKLRLSSVGHGPHG